MRFNEICMQILELLIFKGCTDLEIALIPELL